MNSDPLEVRVNRLKAKVECYKKNPEHDFTLQPVAIQTIERLRGLEYYPPDMLMILEQIGCMCKWGYRGCAWIDWWEPCTIELAETKGRCTYEVRTSNFISPSSLLFFAFDCGSNCYFYEITSVPWKIVVCDGLTLDQYNRDKKDASGSTEEWDGRVIPWEEPSFHDALSIIEDWIVD